MICLSLDTTTDISSIALADDDSVLAEYTFAHHRNLSLRLLPNIKQMLSDCQLTMRDLHGIGVSTGPGSFTGLRIGVVTAKTLAQALNIQIAGVTSLNLLAMPFAQIPNVHICPIVKVRKDEAYYCIYKSLDGKLTQISDYGADIIANIIDKLKSVSADRTIFCGDAVLMNVDTINELFGEHAILTPEQYSYPHASLLAKETCRLIKDGKGMDAYSLMPFYIRKSTPEIRLDEACGRQS